MTQRLPAIRSKHGLKSLGLSDRGIEQQAERHLFCFATYAWDEYVLERLKTQLPRYAGKGATACLAAAMRDWEKTGKPVATLQAFLSGRQDHPYRERRNLSLMTCELRWLDKVSNQLGPHVCPSETARCLLRWAASEFLGLHEVRDVSSQTRRSAF